MHLLLKTHKANTNVWSQTAGEQSIAGVGNELWRSLHQAVGREVTCDQYSQNSDHLLIITVSYSSCKIVYKQV